MAVYKDKKRGTWYTSFPYVDWTGKRCRKLKRGFLTKKEAQNWENHFKLQKANSLDMTFEDFYGIYEADVKPKIRYNTWCTKEHIIKTKILPYFKDLSMRDITPRDIIKWQNIMRESINNKGKEYTGTYLKTVQAQLSSIFNHAVRFYELPNNPVRVAGPMGQNESDEMKFWTKEEYMKFIPTMANKPYSYMAFELLYWCGIRLGELRALTPADFDFETNMLSITKSYQRITSPFKGQMSCVRELKLVQKEKKYILKQLPVKEMECLRTNKHEMKNIKMGADEEWTLCDKKEVLELDISYPIEKIHAQTFGIKISTGKNRQFEIVFCKEEQCCFVDRTTTGVNPHDKFAGKYKAPVDFTQEFLTIKLLMDVSQSELFINNGEVVMSNLLFPEDFYKVKLFATGGDLVIEKSIIYEMDEIMNHPLDGDLI